ncbi:MAG: bifunctional phosphoribosyl-AMP cyclohydrolase/phosphoribosyl-ATP diphosphatase HisIE [Candidatus Bathyarchaeia archaeon]
MVLKLSEKEADEFIGKVDFDKADGLVPVVVQDASNDTVLMQAFMDKEALKLTLTSGKMHFWSRSKKRIWMKGETSENYSLVQNAILDCDNDAILFKVQQIGVCCHTGAHSCFHKPIEAEKEVEALDARILERVFEVVKDRINNPKPDSYVSKLSSQGEDANLQKIGEEATELVLAAKNQDKNNIIHEAADLIFHTMVLLAQKNLEMREVFEELEKRHAQKTQQKTSKQ